MWMVFMSLTSRRLGMDRREDAGEVEEEHVRPQEGRIGIPCHYLMALVCCLRVHHAESLSTHTHAVRTKSKQIRECDYLLCERICLPIKHFFKNYFKCLKRHVVDTISVKFTESEKKETGVQALIRHSRMLLLWQISEPHWSFAPCWENEMVSLWFLRFFSGPQVSVVESVTPWTRGCKAEKLKPKVMEQLSNVE